MNKSEFESLSVLQNSNIFSQRESGITHTPLETENLFFSLIKSGNVEKVKESVNLLSSSLVVGKLSSDETRQVKYWAVCLITLATRSAVSGGVDETSAFNFSDETIFKIDSMENKSEIFPYLIERCIELTQMVSENKIKADYPHVIKKCIHHINTNLHERLSVEELGKVCGLSGDYLSSYFKKITGNNLVSYIKTQRLKEAEKMLLNNYSVSEVAYYLGFCSESYFIKCFKEEFGITPKQYFKNRKI
ncbi:MAG: helix-turn-helix domain-containing protein [Clostridia bacterium]|nr:helix-turn-helix domain-containing protein [Clostridia bacterium]